MAKKTSYKGKTAQELNPELLNLRKEQGENALKIMQGRNVKEYRTNKKNIARVLTELNNSTNL